MWARGSPLGALALVIALAGCASAPPAGESVTGAPSSTASFASPPPATPAAEATRAPGPTPGFGTAPIGPTELATVLSITDGDTIRVDRGFGSEPVRYIGINTPEVGDPGGSEATAENARLVAGLQVVLERDVSETDRFDRLLRYVWIDTGSGWILVNLELVRRGFAQAATYPPDVRFSELFLAAERAARSAEVGLWAATLEPTPAPTPPPTPRQTSAPPAPTPAPVAKCHPSYDPCLPVVADLDCPDVRALGAAPVRVIGPDEYRLDRDKDGIGCE
ncbi:MAG TPA: thermonuclease family protein [Candidatus Sulfomarinibacteraceae bacterium]|nr:thermonuclease family protein [Candidatus Sulfomarinibacteraceae bacterium]